MGFEELDQFGEVGKRSGEAIDLVNEDDVDLPERTSSRSRCRLGRSVDPPE
jgi:hypothetical protein